MKSSKNTNKLQIEIDEMRKKLDNLKEELVVKQNEITSDLNTKEDAFFKMFSEIAEVKSNDEKLSAREANTKKLSEAFEKTFLDNTKTQNFKKALPTKEDAKKEAYANFINSKKAKSKEKKTIPLSEKSNSEKSNNNTENYSLDDFTNGYANLIDSLSKNKTEKTNKDNINFSFEINTTNDFDKKLNTVTNSSLDNEIKSFEKKSKVDLIKPELKSEILNENSIETETDKKPNLVNQNDNVDYDVLFSLDNDGFILDEIDNEIIEKIDEPTTDAIDSSYSFDSTFEEVDEIPTNDLDSNYLLEDNNLDTPKNTEEEIISQSNLINESYLSIKERLDNIKKNIAVHETLLEKADKTIKNENKGKVKKLNPNYQKRIIETQKKQVQNGKMLRTSNSPLSPIKKNKPY